MRLKHRPRNKTLLTILVVFSLLAVSSLAWIYVSGWSLDKNIDSATTSEPTQNSIVNEEEAVLDGDTGGYDTKPEDKSVPHEKEKELPQLYEGENTNLTSGLTGVITTKSIIGNNLVIRNSIDQMVSSGTCDLSLTSNGRTVSRSAEIIQNPSSSTCAGFDIPMSELGPGQWDLSIKVTSENNSMILKESVSI